MTSRQLRRMMGVLVARLPEVELHRVEDPRRRQGRRWSLKSLLNAVVVGLVAGCQSLAQLETLTEQMSRASRRLLGLRGRTPDTTLRHILTRINPLDLAAALVRQIRVAHRRKALEVDGLPFGVVALDGKCLTVRTKQHHPFVQDQTENGQILRTVTACLISSRARVCIMASPIKASDNEQTHYTEALEQLEQAYGSIDLFQVVTYDAGACSKANARYTREMGLHYVMRVNDLQPKLLACAQQALLSCAPRAMSVDKTSTGTTRRSVFYTETSTPWPTWTEAKTLVRVHAEHFDKSGELISEKNRYYVTSLPMNAASAAQWNELVRRHWAVENSCHYTFDAVLKEDDHPWIESNADGALAVLLLRRIAYNILTLYRSITAQDAATKTPWRTIIEALRSALLTAQHHQLTDLRRRYVLTQI